NLDLRQLEEFLIGLKQPKYRARQIFSWIYQKQVRDFSLMTDLSGELRKILQENFTCFDLLAEKESKSEDGTEKFLLKLYDANFVEAVSIPAVERTTGCISSQVGCKFACKFCASGALGFKRDLSVGEMLSEALFLKSHCAKRELTHIVFMGTGEPLDNYDNVLKAVRMINAPYGMNIGARRITISTCGIPPAIRKLAQEGLQIELSISLHAADDKKRSSLMPINKKYPLADLFSACKEYIEKTNRQITFEYILIKGLNSDLQSALNLSKILNTLKLAKVNLIPANPVDPALARKGWMEPPNKLEILMFKDKLIKSGVNVTLRRPRGADIEAACGQLRLRHAQKEE
ncbi:MAG: 23S rRNA (adenine(2503)-C(2))-methyltransferase RlmN, partial [Candidatus Omnitrophica bacterium]|nr:23S rRNA (adenine(2503)-C(2))-methyltransferase RlmN [Candidatus Omnitrophota bacterium]